MCEMMLQPFMKPFRVFSDVSLADFNALLTKAEGRDKLARTFQYFSRSIVGSAAYLQPTAGTLLAKLEGNARTVMVQLASARRTHRWCKEFPVIQSLPACFKIDDPVDRLFELLQKASLAAFLMIDHIGMLKQWKILSGGKRAGTGTIQLGLKCGSESRCCMTLCLKACIFLLDLLGMDCRQRIFTFCNIVGAGQTRFKRLQSFIRPVGDSSRSSDSGVRGFFSPCRPLSAFVVFFLVVVVFLVVYGRRSRVIKFLYGSHTVVLSTYQSYQTTRLNNRRRQKQSRSLFVDSELAEHILELGAWLSTHDQDNKNESGLL
ncbi:Pex11 [Symbiodinium necroappetens]|uniref:Pex11 protein n=1 Tax=Symbiodinium necroappetens TaxID=1628268 RepID=A0A812X749_9DINO|nr:Pex11 [Symbiodinium necroappetens]